MFQQHRVHSDGLVLEGDHEASKEDQDADFTGVQAAQEVQRNEGGAKSDGPDNETSIEL